MSAGRIYWGQIAAVLGLMALGMIIATQWTAARLGYQAALGAADFVFFDFRFYAPWRFFIWWFQYDHYARPVFEQGAAIVLSFATASILSAFGFSRWRAREEKRSNTYGAARWAGQRDIDGSGLIDGAGVVLGRFGRTILRHDGDEHVLVVAPTNSGKSTGIALPTALVWPHSFFTFDMKGEAWSVTSGLRSQLGPVYRFAPASRETHRYNPLTNVRRGDEEIKDAQSLARILVDPQGSISELSHWQSKAFELLTVAILWTLYAEPKKTLAHIARILADPNRPILLLLQHMLVRPIKDGAPHPEVASGARQILDLAEGERSGVVSTALSYLALFRDPILAHATETSDFSIGALVAGDAPVSLYVIVPPEELSRLRVVLRMFFQQALNRLTETAGRLAATESGQGGHIKGRRVLLMLDEFAQLGRLNFFEDALAYLRGYRIKACLITQSLNQIAKAYGPDNAILDHAHVRVAFACNDERTAKRFSDMLGMTTETRSQMNYAGSRMAPWLGHTMVSRQEVPRALLTPGEIMQLPPSEALIFVGPMAPIRARKIRYYAEDLFRKRLRPKVTIDSPTGPGLANPWDSAADAAPPIAPPPSVPPSAPSPPGQRQNAPASMVGPKPTPSRTRGRADIPAGQEVSPRHDVSPRQQSFIFSRGPEMEPVIPAPVHAEAITQGEEPSIERERALSFGLELTPLQRAFFERKPLDFDGDR